jgi:hypothetical protein
VPNQTLAFEGKSGGFDWLVMKFKTPINQSKKLAAP